MSSSYASFAAPSPADASSTLRTLRRVMVMQRLEREERARRRRNTALLFAAVLAPVVAWALFLA